MQADIVEGATFPDYELPDHTGVERKLSFLQGGDSLVLMLGRGVWCPKDRQPLYELVRLRPVRGWLHEERHHHHRQPFPQQRPQARCWCRLAVPARRKARHSEGP
jgi:hypothetical protein